MPIKISELPAASPAAGTDEFPINQGGTTRKLTAAQITAAVRTGPTNQITLGDGSVGAPALAFAADSDTGFVRLNPDTIDVVTGGSTRFFVQNNLARFNMQAVDVAAASAGSANLTVMSNGAHPAAVTARTVTGAGYAPGFMVMERFGAPDGPTPNDTVLGEVRFVGLDTNSAYQSWAFINAVSGANQAGGAPTSMGFWTRPAGGDVQLRFAIGSNGDMAFGQGWPRGPTADWRQWDFNTPYVAGAGGGGGIELRSNDARAAQFDHWRDQNGSVYAYLSSAGWLTLEAQDNRHIAFRAGGEERARLYADAGFVLSTDSTQFIDPWGGSGPAGVVFYGNIGRINAGNSNETPLLLRINTDGAIAAFRRGNNQVGSITVSTTSTSYVTSSDYRLKDVVGPTDPEAAKALLMQLPVTDYTWKSAPEKGLEHGFLAHELAELFPAAVSGEKDAVDEDGEIKPQGVDYSKLVPVIIAALQGVWAQTDAVTADMARIKPAPINEPVLTRAQFFRMLARSGIVTPPEAAQSARTGVMPPAIAALVEGLGEQEKADAEILWATATYFVRSNPLFAAAVAAGVVTDTELDDMFAVGAQL